MMLGEPQLIAEFTVAGIPRPQGSMRAFLKAGRVLVTSDNPKLRPWRDAVAAAAREGLAKHWAGPVSVQVTFRLPRPKGHFGARGDVLRSAPRHPNVKPDVDKLVRALLDSLVEAAVVTDDAQVIRIAARKTYGEPGATVRVIAETTA